MNSLDEYTRGPARELLDAAGEPVTIRSRSVTGYDDYGDPAYTESTLDTHAEIVVRGTPSFERRIEGVGSDVTAVAWVMDDVVEGYGVAYGTNYGSISVSTGGESDDTGPSTLESETHTFQIAELFDEHNGKIRLHLE